MTTKRTPVLWTLLISFLAISLAIFGCAGSDGEATSGTDVAAPETSTEPAATTDSGARGSSTITGSVRFEGQAPKPPKIEMAADPACAALHSEPVYNEGLVLGDGNRMGNVMVSIKSGLPAGSYAPPSEPVVVDQNGCRYKPHVVGIQVGQAFKILNSDDLLHNVHSLSKVNSPFNRAMPGAVTETEFSLNREEAMFRVKCDVHPWMSAWVGVTSHPYFAVTTDDGGFEIGGLPAGSYEVEAWHEILGSQTTSVTVADGESQSADFTFSR